MEVHLLPKHYFSYHRSSCCVDVYSFWGFSSVIYDGKTNGSRHGLLPIISFLIAKLAAYTALGFLLGLLGSAFQLSLTARTILQFAVVVFMLGTALNILEVHPIFRYFIIQPPKFLTRMVRKQSKSSDV